MQTGIIDMSKKSKKKQGTKFYFTINYSLTLQSVYAENIAEAEKYLNERYGEGNYTLCSLRKALSKEEQKRVNKMSEQVARDLFGEAAGRIMHDINTFGV